MAHSWLHRTALLAIVAFVLIAAPAESAPLVSSDADPLVQLDDTDASTLDWEMRANPGGVNGLSFFRSNSAAAILSLGTNSNVGIGEVNPLLDLHIHAGNTPAIRLEQDNSEGWGVQTWDIGANEANFFVRDLTHGSTLPFRIRPGAPYSALDIAASGNVGVGTGAPDKSLHVMRIDGSAQLKVEEASAVAAPRVLGDLMNKGAPALNFTNTAVDGQDWQVAAGTDFVLKPQVGSAALTLSPAGAATSSGALQQNSAAAATENAAAVDPQAVLTSVKDLPVGYFEYAADPANARHLVPAGAAFRTVFGLGASDDALAPADVGGVALVAIQALAANDANFATRTQLGSIDDRLKATEAKLASVDGTVPSLAPLNTQLAALLVRGGSAEKRLAKLEKSNKALLKRLAKAEKTVRALSRR